MANFRTTIRTTMVGVACTYTTTIWPIWFTLTIAMAIHWASWSILFFLVVKKKKYNEGVNNNKKPSVCSIKAFSENLPRTIVATKTTIALTLAIAATNAPCRTTTIIFA